MSNSRRRPRQTPMDASGRYVTVQDQDRKTRAVDKLSLTRKRSLFKSGSHRRPTSSDVRRHARMICPARRLIERRQTTSRDPSSVPSKQRSRVRILSAAPGSWHLTWPSCHFRARCYTCLAESQSMAAPMTQATSRRRGQGEDSIYWDSSKNRVPGHDREGPS